MAAITFDEKGDGKGAGFGRVLKSRVADYFKTNKISQKADWRSWSKAVFFLGSAIAIYFTLVFGNVSSGTAVLLSIAAGLTLAGFGFNVMHDAIHRNFTAKSKLSKALYYSMDLFGVSGNFYRIKHAIMHHTYTNVPGEDPDIEESPIIRMSPLQKHHGYHRYQIIYATFFSSPSIGSGAGIMTVWLGSKSVHCRLLNQQLRNRACFIFSKRFMPSTRLPFRLLFIPSNLFWRVT